MTRKRGKLDFENRKKIIFFTIICALMIISILSIILFGFGLSETNREINHFNSQANVKVNILSQPWKLNSQANVKIEILPRPNEDLR